MAVGTPKLTEVTIDGVDVSAFVVSWFHKPELDKTIKTIDIVLSKGVYASAPNLETAPTNLTVVVKRGISVATEDTLFQGLITSRETVGNKLVVKAQDKLYNAVKKNLTKTFNSNIDTEAGKISEIFKTLLDNAGLSHSSSTITDSGTDIILKTFICNNVDIFERLQLLAELLDWQFYYNSSDDKVYFEPKGMRSGTSTLTVGSAGNPGNITNRPRWVRDGTKVVRKAKLFGGPVETRVTETTVAAAAQTDFVLGNIPLTVRVTVDGTEKDGGIEDQTPLADYFVDRITQDSGISVGQIVFASGLVGGESVVIDYSFASPIAISGENSIADGLDVRLDQPDLITVDDCRNFLNKYLERHANDFLSTTLAVTNNTGMEIGQTVTVVDPNESINETFIITSLSQRFPYRFDEVKVDTEPLEIEEWTISVEDRIKRIEEKLLQEETLVIFLKSGNRILKVGRRYAKLEKQDVRDGGGEFSFILGHFDGGVLGTNKLGDRSQAAVTQTIQQGGDFYLETFLDDDFEGAGNASWSNTGSVTFTSGQIALSSSIDFDNGTITTAKLISTEVSGSFTYEMTADGSNWETVTSGIQHIFTNTGTDLRFRITESAASTGEISKLTIENYH